MWLFVLRRLRPRDVSGSEFRVQGFRVLGVGIRVWGSGFRVLGV